MFDAARVQYLFDLVPSTGELLWRPRSIDSFPRPGSGIYWNRRFAGKVAGTIQKSGYRVISVDGKQHKASVLVWAHVHGTWPEGIVDHENGDRLDDRPCNLRDVTAQQNMRNKARYKSNSSGVVGVYWHKQSSRWHALIGNGGLRYLGSFERKEDAIGARRAAEREIGFHPNHGRAA